MSHSWVGKTALGCGGGCLLLVVVVGVASFVLVRDTTTGFESANEARAEIDERFGDVRAFTPAPGPAPAAEAVERFVAVREATQPARARLGTIFDRLPTSDAQAQELESKEGLAMFREVAGIAGAGFSLGGRMGDFFSARNDAMLEHEIGMGEYAWLYCLSYIAWLQHPLAPAGMSDEDAPVEIDLGDELGSEAWDLVRVELRAMIERQFETLPPDVPADWRETLAAEVELLRADEKRMPWQDGLPEAALTTLLPFRERLEATYHPQTHGLELARSRKRGSASYTVDF